MSPKLSLLKIKTTESHSFKVLAELLQNCVRDAAFQINEEGMFLTCIDEGKCESGTMCIDLKLYSNHFPIFKFNYPFKLGVNLIHFHQMLKSIKKKSTLTLEISEDEPQKLNIIVQSGSENNQPMISHVKVTNVQVTEVDLAVGYEKPIVCSSKDFSQLRTFTKIGDKISVHFCKTWVKFSCSNDELMSRTIAFGETDLQNEDANPTDEIHELTFPTDKITQLVKVAGLSTNVQLYVRKDLPLKIQFNVGSLGNLCIYLKSMQLLQKESEQQEYA